jgi:peptide-methionine (S)-S-oxide reductase
MFLRFLFFISIVMFFVTPTAGAAEVKPMKTETIILAGGCFWCVESDFDKVPGVLKTTSGYTGGTIPNPTYQNYHDEISGQAPHVEAVQIEYNPAVTDYRSLLNYYFRHIDPTDNGGQFCDRGAAYRPVIFTTSDQEKNLAEKAKKDAADAIKAEIKVDILPATKFWPAEGYHQDYHTKSAAKYSFYRWKCGRDARVKEIWGSNK